MELIRLMIREPLERVIKGGLGDWETGVIAGVIRTEVIKVRFEVRTRGVVGAVVWEGGRVVEGGRAGPGCW